MASLILDALTSNPHLESLYLFFTSPHYYNSTSHLTHLLGQKYKFHSIIHKNWYTKLLSDYEKSREREQYRPERIRSHYPIECNLNDYTYFRESEGFFRLTIKLLQRNLINFNILMNYVCLMKEECIILNFC